MTIGGLADFLKGKNIPKMGRGNKNDNSTPLYLNQLRGKKIAIECAGVMYRQNYAALKRVIETYPFLWTENKVTDENKDTTLYRGYWTKPSEDEVVSMFKIYFASFVRRILDTGIIPIFIIEGTAPDMKSDTIKKRIETKSGYEEKIEYYRRNTNPAEYKKNLMYAYPPGAKHVEAVIEVLKEKGVATIRAQHEAEGVCAHLVNDESGIYHCNAALIDDYDIFMYGCKAVLRNLRSTGPSMGHFEAEGYAFEDILYTIGLLPVTNDGNKVVVSNDEKQKAADRFRLMCILSKSDYSNNIRGLGPAKICDLMIKNNIYTYEDACRVNPKFAQIPYNEIVNTINNNKKYTVINPISQ